MNLECAFCRIVAGLAPATVVQEWGDALAILPLGPVVEGHTLIIPRLHVPDFTANPAVTALTARRAAQLARDLDLTAANMITSAGRDATQSIFHLHIHLIPRAKNDRVRLPWHSGIHKEDAP